MSSEKIRFGVIGLGGISRAHVAGLLSVPDRATLVAVCDRDFARAKQVAEATGARAYKDYAELLAAADIDAVDLPLPHNLHYDVARRALEAGKHVIVEKPMAPTSTECKALIDLAAKQQRAFSVSENTPFVSAYIELKKLLDNGKLGQIRSIRTLIAGSEVHRLLDTSNWKGRQDGSVGGAILDAGPHSFHLLKWLFGEIEYLHAISHKLVAASQVEDNALVAGRMKSGATFSSEFTFTAEIPWGERTEVYGSEGVVIIDQIQDPPAVWHRGRTDLAGEPLPNVVFLPDRVEHDPNGWKYRSIASGIAAFATAVSEGRPPPVDPMDGLYAVRVIEAAYRSIAARGVATDV